MPTNFIAEAVSTEGRSSRTCSTRVAPREAPKLTSTSGTAAAPKMPAGARIGSGTDHGERVNASPARVATITGVNRERRSSWAEVTPPEANPASSSGLISTAWMMMIGAM